MRNMFTKVAAAAAILAGASTGAQAYVVLTLTDRNVTTSTNVAQVTCSTFDVASTAACTGLGFLAVVGGNSILSGARTVGSYSIISTSASSNTPGNALGATTNRSQTEASHTATIGLDVRELQVDFTAFDYNLPNGANKLLSGSAGFTANLGAFAALDSVTTFFSVDKFNTGTGATAFVSCTQTGAADFAAGSALAETCPMGPVPWADTFAPGSLFSMRSIQSYRIAVGSIINSTANSSVTNVPEPMTTALVAVALLGVGLATRRGAKKA